MPKPHLGIISLLQIAMKHFITELHFMPLMGKMITATRINEDKKAEIRIITLDDWVKNINGNLETRDFYVLVRIPNILAKKAESIINGPAKEDMQKVQSVEENDRIQGEQQDD